MTRSQNCGNCHYAGKENKADSTKYCAVKREDVQCTGVCGYYMQQRKNINGGVECLNNAV